jgi:hypothetical protein
MGRLSVIIVLSGAGSMALWAFGVGPESVVFADILALIFGVAATVAAFNTWPPPDGRNHR